MVGAESAALSASRMSRERSAGELHSRNGAGERNRTVVSALARPHSAVEPQPQKAGVPSRTLTGNLTLRTRLLCALSYGDEWYARPVTLRYADIGITELMRTS